MNPSNQSISKSSMYTHVASRPRPLSLSSQTNICYIFSRIQRWHNVPHLQLLRIRELTPRSLFSNCKCKYNLKGLTGFRGLLMETAAASSMLLCWCLYISWHWTKKNVFVTAQTWDDKKSEWIEHTRSRRADTHTRSQWDCIFKHISNSETRISRQGIQAYGRAYNNIHNTSGAVCGRLWSGHRA